MKMILFLICSWLVASADGAILCNGTTSFMSMGKATNLAGPNFTVTCWFKRNAVGTSVSTGSGGTSMYPLVMHGMAEADGTVQDCAFAMGVRTNNNNKICGDYEDFGTGLNHPVFGSTTIQSSVWYHAAISFDSNAFRVFLNGLVEGTVTLTNIPRFDSTQPFGIGAAMITNGAPTGSFGGFISEVAVWDIALTQEQIKMLALSKVRRLPLRIRPDRLKGYWPLDDKGDNLTFSTAMDVTGKKNTGFGSNSPVARAEQILSYSD